MTDLTQREDTLSQQLSEQRQGLRAIMEIEDQVSEARLKLESANKSLQLAIGAKQERDELIQSVDAASEKHDQLAAASRDGFPACKVPNRNCRPPRPPTNKRTGKRKEADAVVVVRRADFDYYNNQLFLEQLGERKDRIDAARRKAVHAEEILANIASMKKLSDRSRLRSDRTWQPPHDWKPPLPASG